MKKSEPGQSTVELALVLPLVVLLTLAIVQVGLVALDAILVQHAAREAARAAAVDPSEAVAAEAAGGAAGLTGSRMSVSLSGGRARGDALTAVVSYSSPTNVPMIGRLIGDVALESAVTMRVE